MLSLLNNFTVNIPAGKTPHNISYNSWYDLMKCTTIGGSDGEFLFFGWICCDTDRCS